MIVALVIGLSISLGAYGPGKPLSIVGVVFGVWVIVSSLFDPIDRLRRRLSLSRAIIGMTLAHFGLGVCVIAISTVESYTIERDVALGAGETVALGRYAYRFDSLQPVKGPNYDGVRAQVTVLRDGKPLAVLHPEKRNYWVQRSTMTEAGIHSRWNMDLFAALGEDLQRRALERARAAATTDRLRVAGRGPHGAGRRDRRQRPALSIAPGSRGGHLRCGEYRRGRLNRFILPVVVFLALAGVLYVGVRHSPNKSTMVSALLGKPAPAFELPVLGDPTRKFNSRELAGRPWVINVWGTWCGECRVEHETLLAISRQNRVPLVGLNWKDDDEAAQQWLTQLGNPYGVVAADREGRTPSTSASMARRRPFSSMRTAWCSTATSAR